MTGKMILRPGTPDDDNREYLPEKIKGSDIVVNENGNNSQPYPERLKECHGVIADNIEDEWYEYVPESYDPSKKTPLVLSMHGGLMTGWGQAIYTSWTMAADRDGFILVFPNASENSRRDRLGRHVPFHRTGSGQPDHLLHPAGSHTAGD